MNTAERIQTTSSTLGIEHGPAAPPRATAWDPRLAGGLATACAASLAMLTGAMLTGCTALDQEQVVPAPEPFAHLPGEWRELGPAAIAPEPGSAALNQELGAAAPVPKQHAQPHVEDDDSVRFVVFDVAEGKEYSVRISLEALAQISETARRLGLDQGSVDDTAVYPAGNDGAGDTISYGWSNDDDSRARITSTTSYPYSKIGTLFDGNGDCTGALIGPRHVLTAAHCVYDRETGTYYTLNFKPGRDGTGSMPFGAYSKTRNIWYPLDYKNTPGNTLAVNQWDIALIVFDDAVSNSWMGYAAQPESFLRGQYIRMHGYPKCNDEGAPALCEPKTLWGDTKPCELGTSFSMDSDGWYREIKTNCDGSAGQSGSPFYYYEGRAAVATAVFSQQYCGAGCPDSVHDEWPNVMTRITPQYRAIIDFFRVSYPD